MDVLRSCYTTKMRFYNGGPEVDVAWYFAPPGAILFAKEHNFGSLNYSKGEWDVSDTTIGEVVGAARTWRNGSLPAPYDGGRIAGTTGEFTSGCSGIPDLVWFGSPAMPIACLLSPPPPCFSDVIPNVDVCEISFDGGATWSSLGQLSLNRYQSNITVAGILWTFLTDCGLPLSGNQGIQIQQVSPPGPANTYGSTSYVASYPPTWSIPTDAGSPPGWPGTTIKIRAKCDGKFVGLRNASGNSLTTLSVPAVAGQLAGDSLFAWFSQQGVSNGGSIVVPTFPAGWSSLHIETSNRAMLYWLPNAAIGTGLTLTGIGHPDNCGLTMVAMRTKPAASVLSSQFKDAQAAATSRSAGTLSFTGDNASFITFWNSQGTSNLGAPPTDGFVSTNAPFGGAGVFAVSDGAGPPFNTITQWITQLSSQAAGSYSNSCVATQSRTWWSGFICIR